MAVLIQQIHEIIRKTIREQAEKEMPQVAGDKQDDMIRYVIRHGVKVDKGWMPIKELKKSQGKIDKEKAEKIAADLILARMTPLAVSEDGYIIDGHHRFEAIKSKFDDVDKLVPVLRINLKKAEALKLYADFTEQCDKVPVETQPPLEKSKNKEEDQEMEEVKPEFKEDQKIAKTKPLFDEEK